MKPWQRKNKCVHFIGGRSLKTAGFAPASLFYQLFYQLFLARYLGVMSMLLFVGLFL
jgi:hypothetical protein